MARKSGPRPGTPAFGERARGRIQNIKKTGGIPRPRDIGVRDVVGGKQVNLGKRRRDIEKAMKH